MYSNYYQQPMPQQMGMQQMRMSNLKGRPVSSLEEVKAMSIDFDGSVFYFPDLANNRIYTKQINLDGTASIGMYEFKQIPTETQINYVTRDELENAFKQFKESLEQSSKISQQVSQF